MRNLFIIFFVFISCYSAYASCPVDGYSACIAEFQTVPLAEPMKMSIPKNSTVKEFSSTPSTAGNLEREIDADTSLRKFGPQSQNYGYNSSCQFGVCQTTGTPKTFAPSNNE